MAGLLTVIQDAAGLLTLTRPSSVIGTNDTAVRQLHALAKQECLDLNAKMDWRDMVREFTFTTEAQAEQTTARPDDFKRWVPNSFWNRDTGLRVLGPMSGQAWQAVQASGLQSSVVAAFRERQGAFLMTPTPAAGETIAGEYISSKWARKSDLSEDYTEWQVDTDTSYFDEWLITLGVVWRWRKSKGFPYSEDYDTWLAYKESLYGNDGGASVLSMTGGAHPDSLADPLAPEGFTLS